MRTKDITCVVVLSSVYCRGPVPVLNVLRHGQTDQYLAVSVDDFKELLARIARNFESKKALADALDIDPSRLSRAITKGDFPFNVENCLRLARVSGESPSEVLRAANNADVAELIESLYGPEKTVTDPVLQELLAQWPTFKAADRHYVRLNLMLVLRAKRAATGRPLAASLERDDETDSVSGASRADARDLATEILRLANEPEPPKSVDTPPSPTGTLGQHDAAAPRPPPKRGAPRRKRRR